MSTGLLGLETIAERQSGINSYVSASRLNLWLKCPLAWKLRYLDGIRTPTSPSLFLGKVVHFGLEAVYRHRQLGVTLDAEQVVGKMLDGWARLIDEDDVSFDSVADEQTLQKQACDLVKAYLVSVPCDEKPLAVEVALETPLVDPDSGEDLGMPLVGVIDLVLDSVAGPLICDHKTAARSSEPMQISHEIQLSSYAYLFRHVEQRQEAGLEIRSLIKTRQPKIEFHPYPARSDAHFRRLFSVVREYLDALDSGRFNYRPGFGCSMARLSHTVPRLETMMKWIIAIIGIVSWKRKINHRKDRK